MNLNTGEIVYSIRGRDKGKHFVIVDILPGFVYISNGDMRPLEKPKKKKITHIKSTNIIDFELKEMIEKHKISDKKLRQILKEYDIKQLSLESKEVCQLE